MANQELAALLAVCLFIVALAAWLPIVEALAW